MGVVHFGGHFIDEYRLLLPDQLELRLVVLDQLLFFFGRLLVALIHATDPTVELLHNAIELSRDLLHESIARVAFSAYSVLSMSKCSPHGFLC